MERILKFARVYPNGHKHEGAETFFVEQILHGLGIDFVGVEYADMLVELNKENIGKYPGFNEVLNRFWRGLNSMYDRTKLHTIRNGERWAVGDMIVPTVWSGLPYRSAQIIFAPKIAVKKVWKYEVVNEECVYGMLDGRVLWRDYTILGRQNGGGLEALARHDGLAVVPFMDWFKYPSAFSGQVICWNEVVDYGIFLDEMDKKNS